MCDDILILNKGRQIARGDLNALKLLSHDVYEVAITFESLPSGMREAIAALHPIRSEIRGHTLEFCVKAQEAEALEIVAALAKKGRVLRVEIGGASLEDIFVELTQKV